MRKIKKIFEFLGYEGNLKNMSLKKSLKNMRHY